MDRVHSELFEDLRKNCNVMKRNFGSPLIIKGEIGEAIRKMKLVKVTGPESMVLLKALEDYGIDEITTLLNEIYAAARFRPTSLILYLLHCQRKEATECELHRTISLVLSLKYILKIIMMRVRNKMKPKKKSR